jgi:threonyl-tRNA synthetase
VRDAQVRKVPYVLVVGEREAQNGTASVRARGGVDLGALPVDSVLAQLAAEIASRSATLTVGQSA